MNRKTTWICILIYTFHFSISHIILPSLNKSDVFPFYDWNLFSFSRPDGKFYFLRLLELDQTILNPPQDTYLFLKELKPKNEYLARHQIQRLGEYLKQNTEGSYINFAKQEMEDNLFSGRSVKYELHAAFINYRDVLKTQSIDKSEVLMKSQSSDIK